MSPAAIRRRVRLWQRRLGMTGIKVTVFIGKLEDGSQADCDAQPEYHKCLLRFDPAKVPEDEWDAYIVHELLHYWTWPLEKLAEHWAAEDEAKYETVRDIAESVVTNLERAVLAARTSP